MLDYICIDRDEKKEKKKKDLGIAMLTL